MDVRPPLSEGSISLRLYPQGELPAERIVDELLAQGRLAADAGFDGVMTSEHHGGFASLAGYMPNPLQVAGWLLEAMPAGWAAPCPMLLPLRPAALVSEEVAWLAARFPGRVGLGVAAGSRQDDFAVMGLGMDGLAERFEEGLARVAGMLGGTAPEDLAGDPAIDRCAHHPVPIVSAAMSIAAVGRAARLGVGILVDSLSTTARARTLADGYRVAGGSRCAIVIRRVWVGTPPTERQQAQTNVYRSYTGPAAQSHWQGDQLVTGLEPDAVAGRLATVLEEAGADALNLRVHVPGIAAGEVREQIAALQEVVQRLRAGWTHVTGRG